MAITMTREDLIKALIATGMTDDEIFEAVYTERDRASEIETARTELIDAFEEYLKVLIPDISITQEDKDYLEKAFLSMEKDFKSAGDILRNIKKPTETKDKAKATSKKEATADDILDWFLKELERS